ncbi:MAG: DUF488 family protein [Corynebacterium sp.]|nr:DUF488 family protein [Corynebacterium sp.]
MVDRLWPRGVWKDNPLVQQWGWMKSVAPSTELRKWFAHDPNQFYDFTERYRQEIEAKHDDPEVQSLLTLGLIGEVALLYAAKSTTCNHAVVLAHRANEPLQHGQTR